MRPYFSVGEEVIIQAKNITKHNGPAVISMMVVRGQLFTSPFTGELILPPYTVNTPIFLRA